MSRPWFLSADSIGKEGRLDMSGKPSKKKFSLGFSSNGSPTTNGSLKHEGPNGLLEELGLIKEEDNSSAKTRKRGEDSYEWEKARFERFAAPLRADMAPVGAVETFLVDHFVLSAWKLQQSSDILGFDDEEDDVQTYIRMGRRAQKSFTEILGILDSLRDMRQKGKEAQLMQKSAGNPASGRREKHSAVVQSEEESAAEHGEFWRGRLTIDPNISETSPVVKGTWVTVGQIISLIVDGQSWADILRTHPELTEDDIRACLFYTMEEEHAGLPPAQDPPASRLVE
jgi:uncharacterized protein (DUF433 family)